MPEWTKAQSEVIKHRGGDLLVSAAAGSGKTAVLVERILTLITDEAHPVDIDRLLVVTFTRAAAAEMRERIGRALEERLQNEPDNEHLQRQTILLPAAQISTIHGFCTHVIKSYFYKTDLDPAYRVGDDGELKLIRGDCAKEVIEAAYQAAHERGDTRFPDFAESYATGRDDKALEELILTIHEFARANPDPDSWLDDCVEAVSCEDEQALYDKAWMRELILESRRVLKGLLEEVEEAVMQADGPGGPSHYLPVLLSEREQIAGILASEASYASMQAQIAEIAYPVLPRKKKDTPPFDPELAESVKEARNKRKAIIKNLREGFFLETPEEILAQTARLLPMTEELAEIVRAFDARYSEEKRARGIVDYSDLEHYALRILLDKTEDGFSRSEAAKELAAQFAEVCVDEYQDSNLLQEWLLGAVSGADDGRRDRFMVGDIKQSIYGFRMARPDIFLEKYLRFKPDDQDERRIVLGHNFRSRSEVLELVNDLFKKLMTPALGGIDYDEEAMLVPGAAYPAGEHEDAYRAELLLIDRDAPAFEDDRSRLVLRETEASLIAERIHELMRTCKVLDKETGQLRSLAYRDIAILLRASSGWAESFVRVLQGAGIPAYASAQSGYFSAPEIVTVLHYLRILDNPRQDIPLAAVLRSPIGGFSDEALALMRAGDREDCLLDLCRRYVAEQPESETGKRLAAFFETWQRFRARQGEIPVHELITEILEETGYGDYAAAMPAGAQRRANLDMLIERAAAFDAGEQKGLFRFIRQIEQMEKYEIDYGEVNLFGEAEDTVRIMTIHKSKGLEFPVVFLAGLGGKFNLTDSRKGIAKHAILGVGLDDVDLALRTRSTSLQQRVLRNVMKNESLAEELRVLYVALTRAREKLILSGTMQGAADWKRTNGSGAIPYTKLTRAEGFLPWILEAISDKTPIDVKLVAPEAIGRAQDETAKRLHEGLARIEEAILGEAGSGLQTKDLEEKIRSEAAFVYPHAEEAELPSKLSVSEIKKRAIIALAEARGEELIKEEVVVPLIPSFLSEKADEAAAGARRGTQFHHVLASLDFASLGTEEEIRKQLRSAIEAGVLTEEEVESAGMQPLLRFAGSPLGLRMQRAAKAGKLHREQPFVIDLPAGEIDPAYHTDTPILVQGVIDAWFEEEDGLVIVDYKTDRVRAGEAAPEGAEPSRAAGAGQAAGSVSPSDGAAWLIEKYRVQLDYYRRALSQILDRPVKECWIYSTALGRALRVE